jgi:hypothetical protein
MIGESLLVLVFVYVQNLFADMNGFLVNGVHCRIVPRNIDSGMEEEFLGYTLGISSN